LPRPLLAISILLVVLGLFYAWMPLQLFARSPHMFPYEWRWSASPAQWAVVFIGLGVAVGRYRRWSRPLLLGVVPAFIMVNIAQAIFDIGLNQNYMIFETGFASDAAHIATMTLAISLFVCFCLPQIGAAFAVARAGGLPWDELPLPLASWAIGCIAYALFRASETLTYLAFTPSYPRSVLGSVILSFGNPSVVIGVGGVLTLCRSRYGVFAAALGLFAESIWALFQLSEVVLYHQLPAGVPTGFFQADLASDAVQTTLALAAAIFGVYAAQYLIGSSAKDS
jgi:hypothetical protein